MAELIVRDIFLNPKSSVWWAYSFVKPDRVFSLHSKDRAAAQAKYDGMLRSLREGEARHRAMQEFKRP